MSTLYKNVCQSPTYAEFVYWLLRRSCKAYSAVRFRDSARRGADNSLNQWPSIVKRLYYVRGGKNPHYKQFAHMANTRKMRILAIRLADA